VRSRDKKTKHFTRSQNGLYRELAAAGADAVVAAAGGAAEADAGGAAEGGAAEGGAAAGGAADEPESEEETADEKKEREQRRLKKQRQRAKQRDTPTGRLLRERKMAKLESQARIRDAAREKKAKADYDHYNLLDALAAVRDAQLAQDRGKNAAEALTNRLFSPSMYLADLVSITGLPLSTVASAPAPAELPPDLPELSAPLVPSKTLSSSHKSPATTQIPA